MIYGSVCSGIEAATAAWHPLGWKPSFFSEIEKFPRAVLDHHYPDVPLHGDFTTIEKNQYADIDLLVGGTPCQSFSVAGLRKGMDDDRGNLALEYLKLAQRIGPRWLVWENVPGVLSSNEGRDFGAFIGGLEECGYQCAWRILDAQYFGVPQRRRRVFVVGYLGDWRPAAAVLFERESLFRNPPPSRETREGIATVSGTLTSSGTGTQRVGGNFGELDNYIPVSTITLSSGQANAEINEELSPTLNCNRDGSPIAFNMSQAVAIKTCNTKQNGRFHNDKVAFTLDRAQVQAVGHTVQAAHSHAVATNMQVRRLTPIECERLQGFPDDFTKIPWRNKQPSDCPDGPRYKALGNSFAVPVISWLGKRIETVQEIIDGKDQEIFTAQKVE